MFTSRLFTMATRSIFYTCIIIHLFVSCILSGPTNLPSAVLSQINETTSLLATNTSDLLGAWPRGSSNHGVTRDDSLELVINAHDLRQSTDMDRVFTRQMLIEMAASLSRSTQLDDPVEHVKRLWKPPVTVVVKNTHDTLTTKQLSDVLSELANLVWSYGPANLYAEILKEKLEIASLTLRIDEI